MLPTVITVGANCSQETFETGAVFSYNDAVDSVLAGNIYGIILGRSSLNESKNIFTLVILQNLQRDNSSKIFQIK